MQTEGEAYWPNYDGRDSSGDEICRDGIFRSLGLWPTTPGTVRIMYTAGYTVEELHGQDAIIDARPIVDAVIEEATRRAKKVFIQRKQTGVGFAAGSITSERLGDYSYTVDAASSAQLFGGTFDLMPASKEALGSFVNWGWGLGG